MVLVIDNLVEKWQEINEKNWLRLFLWFSSCRSDDCWILDRSRIALSASLKILGLLQSDYYLIGDAVPQFIYISVFCTPFFSPFDLSIDLTLPREIYSWFNVVKASSATVERYSWSGFVARQSNSDIDFLSYELTECIISRKIDPMISKHLFFFEVLLIFISMCFRIFRLHFEK